MLIIDPSKWPYLATKNFPDSCVLIEPMSSRKMAKSMQTMFPMKICYGNFIKKITLRKLRRKRLLADRT